jgi:hypothetical protein
VWIALRAGARLSSGGLSSSSLTSLPLSSVGRGWVTRRFIADTLTQYPRPRATRLFQMLGDRGYEGSVGTLRPYVRRGPMPTSRESRLALRAVDPTILWTIFDVKASPY